ncbi:MAG TPA: copper homeostasis protein CutC [Acidobacteriota bacterium]|nr:copper homeostasis protein CutC [Acidobacteriota bacterium]
MKIQDGRIQVELVISSLDDAVAAMAAGADRFELCSALAVGGLTPSIGTLELVAELPVPVMCMIRPRQAGMFYTPNEFRSMLRDAERAVEAGANGLVFGFLTSEGEVDIERCRQMVSIARQANVETVFHRAFDVVKDPERALEQLIDLEITRVLTSGRAPAAAGGLAEIRRTLEQANGRIEVLPGGGIEVDEVDTILRETGCRQIHLYLSREAPDLSTSANPSIQFGGSLPDDESMYPAIAENQVRQARQIADRFSSDS